MAETQSAPSLRELSEAIARTIYDTGNKTVATALWEGWTPAPLEVDERTYRLHLDYAAALLAGPLAGRLIDPTTLTEAVAAARAEGVREGLERAGSPHSKDFQLMLVRIIQRHRNGRDLTDTLKGAEDLLKRKGSLSVFREPAPPTTPGGRTDG